MLLTFGASTSVQDRIQQNTALHWAIQTKNSTVLSILVKRNANLHIPNAAGETGLSLLKKMSSMKSFDWIGRKVVDNIILKAEEKKKGWLQESVKDKVSYVLDENCGKFLFSFIAWYSCLMKSFLY